MIPERTGTRKNSLLSSLAKQPAGETSRKSQRGNPSFGSERAAQEGPIDDHTWLGITQVWPTTRRREKVPADDPRPPVPLRGAGAVARIMFHIYMPGTVYEALVWRRSTPGCRAAWRRAPG